MPVADASPLICLEKVNLLLILTEINEEVKCPPTVYEEFVERGEKKGFLVGPEIVNIFHRKLREIRKG